MAVPLRTIDYAREFELHSLLRTRVYRYMYTDWSKAMVNNNTDHTRVLLYFKPTISLPR